MSLSRADAFVPGVDLLLERVIPIAPELVWAAWTKAAVVTRWFTPAPWKTIDCEIDLRPGGIFRTVMQSPDGQTFEHAGCYLEIVPHTRLVWTNALAPGFRPLAALPSPCITAVITLQPEGQGTKYSAVARHKDEADSQAHEAMGFHDGWGKALDQLVEAVQAI